MAKSKTAKGGTALLNTREAAAYVDLGRRTLERYRVSGAGPVFLKLGGRVRYLPEDLDIWLRTQRRKSTSDDGSALADERTGSSSGSRRRGTKR